MSKRGLYGEYYDRFSNKSTPKSTKYRRKRKERKIFAETNMNIPDEHTLVHTPNASACTSDDANLIDFTLETAEDVTKLFENGKKEENNLNEVKRKNILNKVICTCSSTNVADILLMGLEIMRKHCLTWTALLDIFQMINHIFNVNILPNTKHMVKKLMDINTESLTSHFMCSTCNKYLGTSLEKEKTCACGSQICSTSVGSFFIEIDVKHQLQTLLSNKFIFESLKSKFTRVKKNESALEDIYDGHVYKMFEKNLLTSSYDLSYTFNTDGCQAADHSKVTVWPIYIMLHELPDTLRKKYMILAGLWVAKAEPDMNIFLEPFVNQANKLSSEGFKFTYDGIDIVSKLFPLGCCVDSVARCAMLKMKKFNGIYGCTYCEHPTEAVDGVRKYPVQEHVPPKRTDESIKEQMLVAYENDARDVAGVWGPSVLMNLSHFNLTQGMVLDFMHSCLLGVTELYTSIIFKNSTKKYYVGSPTHVSIIDQRLLLIKPPSCISKTPRSIKERNLWKASDFLNWLIIYSLICLRGILRKKYYNNLAMFVAAMNLLLQESITLNMLENARVLLIKFVVNFERLYGKNYMHYNVHLLLHLSDTVKNWGPLWADNTFPFENQNKLLLQMKKSNNQIATQIVNKLLIFQQIPILKNSYYVSERAQHFCNKLTDHHLKYARRFNDCILLGKGKIHNFTNQEEASLQSCLDVAQIKECTRFSRIIYKNCSYASYLRMKKKKNNDSLVETNNKKYGVISNICKITTNEGHEDIFIFLKEIEIDNVFLLDSEDVKIEHIKRCHLRSSDVFIVISYKQLKKTCFLMQSRNEYYLGDIAKGLVGRTIN